MTAATSTLAFPQPCGPVTGQVLVAPAGPVADPLTARNRATWTAGDFDRIAAGFALGAQAFVERVGVSIGDVVLDAASGTGNLAIPAARLGGIVVGVDIAPNLVETARAHAAALKLDIQFDEGNVEALPYSDRTFTTVMSMFGVMFAPRHERVVEELLRVTRPGGRIALANWTPHGFIGRLLRLHTAQVPPPAGVASPLLWGDEVVVRERLAPHAGRIRSLSFTPRTITFTFPTDPAGVVDLFRKYYGPSVRTFAALDEAGQQTLASALTTLWSSHNRATDGSTRVEAEYLDVRIDVA